MKKELIFVSVGAVLMCAMPVHGARLAGGDGPRNWPVNVERHVIRIARKAADETAKRMIEIAEAAKPATGAWWMRADGSDVVVSGLKMPYALTLDTLEYFTERIKDYQNREWPNRFSEPYSSLTYSAVCKRQETFTLDGVEYRDVYVVKMEMSFSTAFTEATTGGIRVAKTRTVVLDLMGSVKAISGDKNEDYFMWMQ